MVEVCEWGMAQGRNENVCSHWFDKAAQWSPNGGKLDSKGRATLLARVSREQSADARCLALADAAEDSGEVLLALA